MNIIIVAGGTGGHIFPALAVVKELQQIDPKGKITWVTTDRGRERELAVEYSVTPLILKMEGFQRRISLQPIRALFKYLKARLLMQKEFAKDPVDAVIAFGGYVCGPVISIAKSKKVPIYLHEQNSVTGLVNRLYGKHAEKLLLGMPLVKPAGEGVVTEVVGTPVRVRKESYKEWQPPFSKALMESRKRILISGGSQGAVSMNKVLIEAVKEFTRDEYMVIWQTGGPGLAEIESIFADNDAVYAAASFDDLYPLLEWADLLIGRSGASTISEAQLFGIPSIFIPLPWSAENHQWFNAEYAESAHWAVRIEQNDESDEKIIAAVMDIFSSYEVYTGMQSAALASHKHDAAKSVAEMVVHGA